ncbi:hypothetical protein GCM10028801_30880 [Nocardioides maradonensis]
MPKTVMEEGRDLGASAPDDVTSTAEIIQGFLSPVMALGPAGHLGPRAEIEKELDLIAAAIRTFYAKPADMVMRECSAYTARLTELCVLLHRVEGLDRQYTRVRTQQVERFLAECERQWKSASRLIEVQKLDAATLRGQI